MRASLEFPRATAGTVSTSFRDFFLVILLVLCLAESKATAAASSTGFSIVSYGAVGDGNHLNTKAIQMAVDACYAAGGGKVLIPAGRYLTGPIFLRSHMEVELAPGAVLLGSTNFADYPAIEGRWEGIERRIYASLLNGRDLDHVSITGHGVLEGQGSVWWDAQRKTAALRKKLGLLAREPDNPPDAPLRWPRPRMINLYNCTNVVLRDITILNSPSWNVHPVYCEHFLMDNVTVISPSNSPNTDAVDPDSCRDVHISNCFMDVGDDCVVIKSGFNQDGRRVGRPCEDVLINNCTFAHGHGGVVIGSEMSGSVRNVVVENCICDGTQRGLRVKTALGRGGVIEHFRASNLVMRNITDTAFSITAAYGDGQEEPDSAKTAPETIPVMRHIHWSNISVVNAKRLGDISSLKQSPLEDFSLRNVQAIGTQAGIRCNNSKGLVFENISIQECSRPVFEAAQVSGLELRGLSVPGADEAAPLLLLKQVTGAFITDCSVPGGKGVFLKLGEGTSDIATSANRLGAEIKERE